MDLRCIIRQNYHRLAQEIDSQDRGKPSEFRWTGNSVRAKLLAQWKEQIENLRHPGSEVIRKESELNFATVPKDSS